MKRVLVLALAGATVCGAMAWAAGPQETVDARVAVMKQLGGKVNEAFQASSTPAAAKAKIAEALNIAESIPSHFPAGTADGDAGVTSSRALPDIWKKPAEFKAAADALVAALKATDALLDGGDAAKIEASFGEVRKACGGCHTPFRGPAKS